MNFTVYYSYRYMYLLSAIVEAYFVNIAQCLHSNRTTSTVPILWWESNKQSDIYIVVLQIICLGV